MSDNEQDQMGGDKAGSGDDNIALCASCDRCRARKTKCDGLRPCSNCIGKYLKKHKLTSSDGLPMDCFECIYSPAKRRGPIPGRTSGTTRKADALSGSGHASDNSGVGGVGIASSRGTNLIVTGTSTEGSSWLSSTGGVAGSGGGAATGGGGGGMIDPQVAAFLAQQSNKDSVMMDTSTASSAGVGGGSSTTTTNNNPAANNLQQQIQFLQQQIQQHQVGSVDASASEGTNTDERMSRRQKPDESSANRTGGGVPRTIMNHTHLLDRNDPEGARLRAFYKLSIDELFCLPATPTDEEYCNRLNIPGITPSMIPGTHLAALSAARFAEAALGAIVHNEVSLAMELCNAVVHCLRESVEEPVQTPVIYEVAKAYFLLGVFRAYRGDMPRYFKYRRVCMTYLAKLESNEDTQTLLASISYLDAWAYMIYNANEESLPEIDNCIPPPPGGSCGLIPSAFGASAGAGPSKSSSNDIEQKYNIRTDMQSIASNPQNKNWIQGAPPVYLNNEAPARARVIDALACAVRTCCDQANGRFTAIAASESSSMNGEANSNTQQELGGNSLMSPTTTAVLAHENELCSRNLILSAFALMQANDNGKGHAKNAGQHLVISAMDAFLENADEGGNGGFSDSQIQSLLSVCNTAIENPLLLHHAGPTYHMVSNAAILLSHFLNGMHAMKHSGHFSSMEETMFDEVVDTFIAIRKLLTIHRRKLPVKLRCHGIPRPNFGAAENQPFIDLGETLLCVCRGCQGFVLMACSPCVAAERARNAASRIEVAAAQEAEAFEMVEFGGNMMDLGSEFNMDDDFLLSMISSLISS